VHSGGQILKFSIFFKSVGKKNITIKEKRQFLSKIGFRQNRFWFLI